MGPKPVKTVQGKLCLITGAASGIGRATALAAATKGARLVITDRDEAGLTATADDVLVRGGTVVFSRALDITDHDAVVAMAADVHAAHGSMDVVMNVAGISIWGSVQELQHEQWRSLIEVNLMGPISVIECFVPPMIEARRGGHLVNVSSAAGLLGLPWHAAYSASKFGLRGVSEVLRFDLRRSGIGVSLVCPGGVATPLVQTVVIQGVDAEHPVIRRLKGRFEKRAVTPEHVADRILWGVERNRYLVLTSPDIWLGFFLQRKFALPYELAMRVMNDGLVAAAKRSRRAPR